MAILKLVPFKHQSEENLYINSEDVIRKKINYITRPEATINHLCGGYNLLLSTPENMIEQFIIVNRWYYRDGHIPVKHIILSLDPYSYIEEQVTPQQLALIVDSFCLHEFGDEYQVIYGIHEDTKNLHAHIIVNTVNLRTGLLLPSNRTKDFEMYEWMSLFLKLTSHWKGNFPINNLYLHYE